MADGQGGSAQSSSNNNSNETANVEEEKVKLFVGQVPKHMTEDELFTMFQEFAIVDEVNIIKDKITKMSRGCCFLTCPSKEEADKAVVACHNKRTLLGASSPMQVKYAEGELERLEHKLFIGMLPKIITEPEITELFSNYGTIKDLQILKGSQQTSRGCAFLKYETKEQAVAAIEALNGKHKLEGSTVPLVVKWADTEKERQARKAQKAQSQSLNMPVGSPTHQPSLFGAMPLGYISPYNGYGYQGPGNYNLMQYQLQSMQNQPGYHNIVPSISQAAALRGLQYASGYPGGLMSPRPLSPSGALHVSLFSSNSPSSSASLSPSGQPEGPPGANLFIYHIPQEFGDQELASAFQQFGHVLSAKVFVDKATGVSKCFGFVSYDSPASAQSAIDAMNGSQLGSKKLKVQLKRDNKQIKPLPY